MSVSGAGRGGTQTYAIDDKTMIESATLLEEFVLQEAEKLGYVPDDKGELPFPYPLDAEIIGRRRSGGVLKELLVGDSHEIPYSQSGRLDGLWERLIDKSICCLRFFDKREPFHDDHELPIVAYGMDSLRDYRNRYTAFEGLMYGSSPYYRDHVFHVFRVWLLGVFALTQDAATGDAADMKQKLAGILRLDGGSDFLKGNFFEIMSMWTIAALCHDLGYPLEKAEQILGKTKDMMREFIPNPNVLNNFSFTGTQDNINDYVLKFMSTKMVKVEGDKPAGSETDGCRFYGRIQPKYYLKYAKSLERFKHGVIASVIIYKMLLFFLESDFNMNDDHVYSQEDARQFYIRREILRAIASHTCSDAYSIHLVTLPSILFVCDELQEWGRKTWGDIYSGGPAREVGLIITRLDEDGIEIEETMKREEASDVAAEADIVKRVFESQYSLYKTKFRDGQDTAKRDFSIRKTMTISLREQGAAVNSIIIVYEIPAKGQSSFRASREGDASRRSQLKREVEKRLSGALYYSDFSFA